MSKTFFLFSLNVSKWKQTWKNQQLDTFTIAFMQKIFTNIITISCIYPAKYSLDNVTKIH